MRVTEFVVCEDVRRETGDKVSLMGVLGSAVTVDAGAPDRPVFMRLSVFVGIDLEEGDSPAAFEFEIRRGAELVLSSRSSLPEPVDHAKKRIQLALGSDRVRLREPGRLDFSLVVSNAAGAELLREQKGLSIVFAPHRPA